MKVKVKRVTIKTYNEIIERLGPKACFIEVPSTKSDTTFTGIFTDLLKQTIAVSWPIDRPTEHQHDFARDCANGAWPVEAVEIKRANNHLKIARAK